MGDGKDGAVGVAAALGRKIFEPLVLPGDLRFADMGLIVDGGGFRYSAAVFRRFCAANNIAEAEIHGNRILMVLLMVRWYALDRARGGEAHPALEAFIAGAQAARP